MRVLVCGGRDYGYKWEGGKKIVDYDVINKAIDIVKEVKPSYLIHGGATGGDEIAVYTAKALDLPVVCFSADWKTHGKAAGPIRNQKMLDEGKPDLVVAFPGSSGTADMVRRANKAGVEVKEVK